MIKQQDDEVGRDESETTKSFKTLCIAKIS